VRIFAHPFRGYDTAVERPSPQELRRVARALALGVALGVILLLAGHRSRG